MRSRSAVRAFGRLRARPPGENVPSFNTAEAVTGIDQWAHRHAQHLRLSL